MSYYFDSLAIRIFAALLFISMAVMLSSNLVYAYQDEFVAQISEVDIHYSTVVLRSKKFPETIFHLPKSSFIYLADGSIGAIEKLVLNNYVLVLGDLESGVIHQLNVLE